MYLMKCLLGEKENDAIDQEVREFQSSRKT